jgi:hypothetical protein
MQNRRWISRMPCGCERAFPQSSFIDPLLNGDMRARLALQIARFRIAAVIGSERALDIDRMCIVTLDQVAVVAVHGAHERGQRRKQALRQGAPQAGRLLGQFEPRSRSSPRRLAPSRNSSGSIRVGDSPLSRMEMSAFSSALFIDFKI